MATTTGRMHVPLRFSANASTCVRAAFDVNMMGCRKHGYLGVGTNKSFFAARMTCGAKSKNVAAVITSL